MDDFRFGRNRTRVIVECVLLPVLVLGALGLLSLPSARADRPQGGGLRGDPRGRGGQLGTGIGTERSDKNRSLAKFEVVVKKGDVSEAYVERIHDDIRNNQLRGVKNCHLLSMKKGKGMEGALNISFKIRARGKVIRVKVKGFNRSLDKCIRRIFKKSKFESPKNPKGRPISVMVHIPMYLKASYEKKKKRWSRDDS